MFRLQHLNRAVAACAVLLILPLAALADAPPCSQPVDVCEGQVKGAFPLIRDGAAVRILMDEADWPGALRAGRTVQEDFARLARSETVQDEAAGVIIAGTIGRSGRIDALIAAGKLDVSAIDGVWEGFVQAVIEAPEAGIDRALVIAGADQRGTIFGLYELSERAGVSPWFWWADVPVPHRPDLSVLPGQRADWPRVKYRGIFINDEKPALYGWVNHWYGGFTSPFYEKVFELILRMRGNYLWPAMWGEAIFDDDPLTGPLAIEMGFVLGTSHHEPLGRAHVEWARYGEGEWDYTVNAEVLREFWRGGMERQKHNETLVTLGMRGDGDEAMTEGTAIALLEQIVSDQRQIIEEVTGRPASEQPSIWALYKEVQDYYDQGMQVPEDITLLFADDNWGNIRRLPQPGSERAGGYGVYYHFDYVGGPRNYKWLNTSQISRVWEQMNLAWEYGARQIWIVNVGDIKPMEFPISFFLQQAWDPERMPQAAMEAYAADWAARTFPPEHAAEIGDILTRYANYASRRKPELVDWTTFSPVNFGELEWVTVEWLELAERADAVRAALTPEYDDAYVQLVWWPVHGMANLYQLYHATALNHLYAEQGRAVEAHGMAIRAEEFFARDHALTRMFHEDIAAGKWVHMMSQTRIGYTYWQQPEEQAMPSVQRPAVPRGSALGVAVEGSRRGWRTGEAGASLPRTDVFTDPEVSIELFPAGDRPVTARLSAREDWIVIPEARVTLDASRRVTLLIDWTRVPPGRHTGRVTVRSGLTGRIDIAVPVFKPDGWQTVTGYPLGAGYAAIEASRASRVVNGQGLDWQVIPDLGRAGDSITLLPVTAPPAEPGRHDSPRLEFDLTLFEPGDLTVQVELAPTLDFKGQGGLRYAVSLDDGEPVIVNIHRNMTPQDWNENVWEAMVARNAHQHRTVLPVAAPGPRVLKLWAIDAPLLFQKVTVSQVPVPESYLGPPPAQAR
ncbi:glycosyl hydrolase 115 family protein [Hyphomonas sp.]|uniref:glycosyl hydrolase 115 family protein n=1 Tax=Hyphomonas sp. TaxID=87 RepID=UPI00391C5610